MGPLDRLLSVNENKRQATSQPAPHPSHPLTPFLDSILSTLPGSSHLFCQGRKSFLRLPCMTGRSSSILASNQGTSTMGGSPPFSQRCKAKRTVEGVLVDGEKSVEFLPPPKKAPRKQASSSHKKYQYV